MDVPGMNEAQSLACTSMLGGLVGDDDNAAGLSDPKPNGKGKGKGKGKERVPKDDAGKALWHVLN
eukprot:10071620-Alexandrium_andersonii.AAC.1